MAINIARVPPCVGEVSNCGIIERMPDTSALARLPPQSTTRGWSALELDR